MENPLRLAGLGAIIAAQACVIGCGDADEINQESTDPEILEYKQAISGEINWEDYDAEQQQTVTGATSHLIELLDTNGTAFLDSQECMDNAPLYFYDTFDTKCQTGETISTSPNVA